MNEATCGKVFVTEYGDFSFQCVNCNLVTWEFSEYKNHIVRNHLADLFTNKLDRKKSVKLEMSEDDAIEEEIYSHTLKIEKLLEHELKDEDSECEPKYFVYNEINDQLSDSESEGPCAVRIEFQENQAETISCKNCREIFESYELLESHKLKCGTDLCPLCSMVVHGDVSKHIATCRFSGNKKVDKERKCDANVPGQKFVCTFCDRSFHSETALQKHSTIHETNSDKCDICGKRFRKLDSLRNHIRRHKGERPFKCSKCSAAFNDKINLKTHYIVKHTEGLKVPCGFKDCGKIFKTLELKKRHESYVHMNDRNYLCLSCGMSFKTSSKLNEHTKKKHLDYEDRPFECETCKKKFIFPQDLKNHQMTHTGEKPYKCEICTKAFIKKYELKKHVRRKHSDSDLEMYF